MSQERLVVLCVGGADTERWIASSIEPYGGYVYRADDLTHALGMYVSYMPELVVLDTKNAPELATQVYTHLRSIDVEPILILDHESKTWNDLVVACMEFVGVDNPLEQVAS